MVRESFGTTMLGFDLLSSIGVMSSAVLVEPAEVASFKPGD